MKRKLLFFAASIALVSSLGTTTVLAQDEPAAPLVMDVQVGDVTYQLASIDHLNPHSSDDGCWYKEMFIPYPQGTDEVSASGSYSLVRLLIDEQMVWEILPHGASFTMDSNYPIDGIAELSPVCSLQEAAEKVAADIVAVTEAGNFQVRGLVNYLDSGFFGPFAYNGEYYGGLVDPTTSDRCHASVDRGGVVKGAGSTIQSDNWMRVQIHRKGATPEFDIAVAPGTVTIERQDVIIRWWDMVNCDEFSTARDAADSPGRRRTVALADSGGYVQDWQDSFISEENWISWVPAGN
jgi:hypothetical protein